MKSRKLAAVAAILLIAALILSQHEWREEKSSPVTEAIVANEAMGAVDGKDDQKIKPGAASESESGSCQPVEELITDQQAHAFEQWKAEVGLLDTTTVNGQTVPASSGYQVYDNKTLQNMVAAGDARAKLVLGQRGLGVAVATYNTYNYDDYEKFPKAAFEAELGRSIQLLEEAFVEGGFGMAALDAHAGYTLLTLDILGRDYWYGEGEARGKVPEADKERLAEAVRNARAFYAVARQAIPNLPDENASFIASALADELPTDDRLEEAVLALTSRLEAKRKQLGLDPVRQPIPDGLMSVLQNSCHKVPGMHTVAPAPTMVASAYKPL